MKIKFFLALLYINVCFASASEENAKRDKFVTIMDDCYAIFHAMTQQNHPLHVKIGEEKIVSDGVTVTRQQPHPWLITVSCNGSNYPIEVNCRYSTYDFKGWIPVNNNNPDSFGPLAPIVAFFASIPLNDSQYFSRSTTCESPDETTTVSSIYSYSKGSFFAPGRIVFGREEPRIIRIPRHVSTPDYPNK